MDSKDYRAERAWHAERYARCLLMAQAAGDPKVEAIHRRLAGEHARRIAELESTARGRGTRLAAWLADCCSSRLGRHIP